MKLPEIIAHRGVHSSAPENSLAAVSAATAAGADGVEFDVHAAVDGTVVVHHDALIANRAGHLREIANLSPSDLAECLLEDGTRVPMLREVLALLRGRAHAYVEIKAPGIERNVLDAVHESGAAASIHSFDHRTVMRSRAANRDIRCGILLSSRLVDSVHAMNAADAQDVWQHHEQIDAGLVRAVHAAGGRMVAWTVNDPERARTLADIGVDAICTDHVVAIRSALEAH